MWSVPRAEDARDDEYYTAEIVVVELMEGYTEIDSEEVFIYDLPVASAGVKYEDVSVIRADGTAETVTIDLSKSDLSAYREYDPAWGKYIMPGLYYMWESDVKDVYVVSKMSWNDIADSRYVVGTVLKDTATGADDWTSFVPYYNNTNYITDLSGFVILKMVARPRSGTPRTPSTMSSNIARTGTVTTWATWTRATARMSCLSARTAVRTRFW